MKSACLRLSVAVVVTALLAGCATGNNSSTEFGYRSADKVVPQVKLSDLPTNYAEDAKQEQTTASSFDPLGHCRGGPAIQQYAKLVARRYFEGATQSDWIDISVYEGHAGQLFAALSTTLKACKPVTDTHVSGTVVLNVTEDVAVVSGPTVGNASLWWQNQTALLDSSGYLDPKPGPAKNSVVLQAGDYVLIISGCPSFSQDAIARLVHKVIDY